MACGVVTAGSYHSPSASESVYVYEEAGVVKLCFLTSGAVFTVMAMPDPAATVSTAIRPKELIAGTVVVLQTGNRGRLSQETSAIKEKQKGLSSLRCNRNTICHS